MMHAIKGGWVGQTFALATCSDSGGRKARIRRSKEERKAMVESFIKKYQNSNSGNFPSLNLTHKEVGGSFYTVREIVREIIQENRVLGPAKFPSEELSDDNLLEHYPLGSISIESQRSLSPSGETKNIFHTSSKQNHGSGEELTANSNGQFFGSEHQRLDRGQVVNGAIETVKDDIESDERSITEAATYPHKGSSDEHLPDLNGIAGPDYQKFDNEPIGNVSLPTDEDEESNGPSVASPVSIPHPRIIQEHNQQTSGEQVLHSGRDFPGHGHLKSDSEQDVNGISRAIGENDEYGLPVPGVAVGEDSLDAKKVGIEKLESSNAGITHAKADIVVEKFPLRLVAKKFDDLEGRSEQQSQETKTLDANGIEQDRVQVLESSSSLVNVDVGEDLAGQSLKSKSEPVDKAASLSDGNSSLEMLNCSTTKKAPVLDINNVAEIGAKVSSPIEAKPVNVPTGISENFGNINRIVSHEQAMADETTGIKDNLNIEHDSSSRKGSNSTLDRINLGTWERTSEQPAESEMNPVFSFFKAFVTAFVKFFTE